MQKNADSSSAESRLLQLFTAVKKKNLKEVCALISQLGGYVNNRIPKDADGHTPLHAAILTRNIEILRLFVEAENVDLKVKDKYGITALHLAANYTGILKLLIGAAKFDDNVINAKNKNGFTVLDYVLRNNNFDVAKILVNAGADSGESVLHLAVKCSNTSFLEFLLSRGKNVNYTYNGETSLHLAAKNNRGDSHLAIIKVLLKHGADVNSRDEEGQSPVETLFLENNSWNFSHPSNKKTLLFLLSCLDVHSFDQTVKNLASIYLEEDKWKTVIEHIAKLQALNLQISHPNILNFIESGTECKNYFVRCKEELILAKNTKIRDCWVTYFNILTDKMRRLKNFAGNKTLIEEFKKSNCIINYPIYGASMLERMNRGIQKRKLFDESSVKLSYYLPIINPDHLITRDIFDCCLTTKDLSKFCE